MAERKLAHIEKIEWIKPIEGADNIELIGILGWVCIAKIGEFKVGDTCVYFEIDSKLPEAEWSEFMRSKHFQVKTMKLGKFKVISQGLALPLSAFEWWEPLDESGANDFLNNSLRTKLEQLSIGDDCTELLGVKYSVKEDNIRKAKNTDPNAKYNSMAARHPKLFKTKPVRWLMKRLWGKKLLFLFFGKKKDKPLGFPTQFEFVHKTDEERCLIGDTKIITNNGVFRIADIVNKRLDVLVKSYNINSNKIEYKPIKSYQKYNNSEELLEIEYSFRLGTDRKNRIRCTKDHKFFNGYDYIKAENLKINDNIYMIQTCYPDEVIPIVYGMLLGDSSIGYDKRCKSKNIKIQTTHGESQLDYLKFKKKLFGSNNFKYNIGRSGYCDNNIYSAYLIADKNISMHINNDCYINNKKTITKKFIEKLTPISLAFWYMDDGNLKHKDLKDPNSPNIIISTCGFSKEENELLIDTLINKFGVQCNLRKEKDKYWSIYITTEGTKVFLNLITKYMPKCMRYKTLVELEDQECVLDNICYNQQEMLLPTKITNIKIYDGKRKYLTTYDLEIEYNHNFFANNILTHNCENMPWVLQNKNPLTVSEKLDGTSSTFILERKKYNKFEFYVLSRNVRQMTPDQKCYHDDNIYWEMAFKYNIEQHLKDYLNEHKDMEYVCIQGESVGNVQGNPLKLKDNQLFVFNFINSKDGRIDSEIAKPLIESWGMQWVPILDTNYIMPDTMEEFKQYATAKSVLNPNVYREGVVLRDYKTGLSFKNVSREYLLKHNG